MGRYGHTMGPYHPKCHLCPLHRGTSVHKRLIHHMHWKVAFHNMWLSTRGKWQDTVIEWWNRASAADLHHVSCLRIPRSLWDHIPRALRQTSRSMWPGTSTIPYMAYANCTATSPRPLATHRCRPHTSVPAWYTNLRPRAVQPNPTDAVKYRGPRERPSWRDGRASQAASHRRAVCICDRPQSYLTRSWAVKYLDQCLASTTTNLEAQ